MKKTFIIALSAAGMLLNTSCGDKKPAQEPIVAPEGMHVLDLTKYGKSFAIFVPDTVQNKMTIVEQSYGALDITVGANFAVSISEQAEDIAMKKKEVSEDEVNKLKSFITDEPTAILWESAITESEFHFIINQKIDNSDYNIQDVRNTEAKPYSKEAIQKMFDSAKNIKEIKKAAPEA
ncbi:MAG: hypothetical protein ACK50A_06255 [Sphingobacteriaceae bacterium]|jgi:hypothetical protein